MVRIETLDGRNLELYPKTSITWKQRNALLYEDVIPVTYSLPFKFPLKGTQNSILLGFPEEPQNVQQLSKSIDVNVYLTSALPRRGILKLKTANEDYAEGNITIDKSTDDIAAKKLSEVLKDEVIFSIGDIYQKMEIRILENPYYFSDFVANGGQVGLTINEQEFITPAQGISDAGALAMHEDLRDQINAANINVTAVVLGTTHNLVRLELTKNTPGTSDFFKLNLKKYLDAHNADNAASSYIWVIDEETDWIVAQIAAVQSAVSSITGGSVIFPPIKNAKFASDERWVGWQNVGYNLNYSDYEDILAYLTPCIQVTKIIQSIMQSLGYSIINNYINTGDFAKFYLYSNIAADAGIQVYGDAEQIFEGEDPYPFKFEYQIDKEINVHAFPILLGRYCSDFTIKEFLTAIRSAFNLEFDYDVVRKEVTILPARNGASNLISKAIDVTQFAVFPIELTTPEGEVSTIKSMGFTVDTADEQQKTIQTWQKPIIVNPSGIKETTIPMVSIKDNPIDNVPVPTTPDATVPLPACEIDLPGVINGSGSASKFRIVQYRGKPALTGIQVVTSRNLSHPLITDINTSLEWSGANGLYEKFWKGFIALRNENDMMRCTMTYPPEIAERLEDFPVQAINGSFYLWKEADLVNGPDMDKSKCLFVLL